MLWNSNLLMALATLCLTRIHAESQIPPTIAAETHIESGLVQI